MNPAAHVTSIEGMADFQAALATFTEKAKDALGSVELERKKMMKIGDRKPDTTDQEKALRRAQAWLEHAEEKLAHTRHWQRAFPDAMLDYQGPARQLQFMLEAQVPQMSAYLHQKIEALEKYQQLG